MSSLYGIALQRHEDSTGYGLLITHKNVYFVAVSVDRRISDRFTLCYSSRQSVLAGVVHVEPKYFSCRHVKLSSLNSVDKA